MNTLERLWDWHQHYVEKHPHLSSWIGVIYGIGLGLFIGFILWF